MMNMMRRESTSVFYDSATIDDNVTLGDVSLLQEEMVAPVQHATTEVSRLLEVYSDPNATNHCYRNARLFAHTLLRFLCPCSTNYWSIVQACQLTAVPRCTCHEASAVMFVALQGT